MKTIKLHFNMTKHFILAAFAALMASTVCMAHAPVQFSNQGNVMTITSNGKTVNMAIDSTAQGGAVAVFVVDGDTVMRADVNDMADRLNDTLAASSFMLSSDDGDSGEEYAMRELDYEYAGRAEQRGQTTAIIITAIVFGSILLVIVACLLIYYMNRRNRLKVVERAIDNNYQLPDSFYTGKQGSTGYVADENTAAHETASAPAAAPTRVQQVLSCMSEREMRQGINLSIVGLGLVLFFSLMGLEVLAALMVIPLLIGLSRLVVPYLMRRRMSTPPPPQQPAAGQEPPIFNHNDNEGQQPAGKTE